jgi:hypothetical protein
MTWLAGIGTPTILYITINPRKKKPKHNPKAQTKSNEKKCKKKLDLFTWKSSQQLFFIYYTSKKRRYENIQNINIRTTTVNIF